MRIILALGQSGVSNFALVRKKLRTNAQCLNQSAISNFALYVMNELHLALLVVIYVIFGPHYGIPLAFPLNFPMPIGLCYNYFTHYVVKRLTSRVGLFPYPMSVVCLLSSHTTDAFPATSSVITSFRSM